MKEEGTIEKFVNEDNSEVRLSDESCTFSSADKQIVPNEIPTGLKQ